MRYYRTSHDSSCTDKTDWLLWRRMFMSWLSTSKRTTASYLQTSQPFLWVCSSTPGHCAVHAFDATTQIQLQKPAIRDSPHSAIHGVFHSLTCINRHGPCSDSLWQFNYLSVISIFTSQLVCDTRLPLVECGRACHAPAIIRVHPIHSPTTTVVIHPVSNPSNPSALFCKPDEWLGFMADIAAA